MFEEKLRRGKGYRIKGAVHPENSTIYNDVHTFSTWRELNILEY